jgi:hypothetical protein
MSKYSEKGSRFVGSKIQKLMKEGYDKDQSSAIALSMARKKKLKVPNKK